MHAPVYDNQGNEVDNQKCPFCRAPTCRTNEEMIQRIKKRMDAGDAIAIHNQGCYYSAGMYGLPQNHAMAMELWHKAGELGHSRAYYHIGNIYVFCEGEEVNMKKAIHYWELAAMRGCVTSRHNLGYNSERINDNNRALKHYLIAVRDGDINSMKKIKGLFMDGNATKDDYAAALRLYQAYLDEIKSDQRDKAAAEDEDYKYY